MTGRQTEGSIGRGQSENARDSAKTPGHAMHICATFSTLETLSFNIIVKTLNSLLQYINKTNESVLNGINHSVPAFAKPNFLIP